MRRSAKLFRERWGETLTGDLTIGVVLGIAMIPGSIVSCAGVIAFDGSNWGSGAILLSAGIALVAPLLALQRARRRADAAAAALGLRVVAIRKVDLNAEFNYDASVDSAAGGGTDDSESRSGPNIEPGLERVSVAVAVVYEIGP